MAVAGEHLSYLAGHADAASFAAALGNVSLHYTAAVQELKALAAQVSSAADKPRALYSVALLESASK